MITRVSNQRTELMQLVLETKIYEHLLYHGLALCFTYIPHLILKTDLNQGWGLTRTKCDKKNLSFSEFLILTLYSNTAKSKEPGLFLRALVHRTAQDPHYYLLKSLVLLNLDSQMAPRLSIVLHLFIHFHLPLYPAKSVNSGP